MSAPLVSVITPAHNSGRFLEETVRSVIAQSFGGWEMLIAENGSTDDTVAIAERLAREDSRIRLLELRGRAGPAGARNAALEVANGRYVAFLDADDLWLPEKLEAQLEFARSRSAAFTCTSFRRIDERGAPILSLVAPPSTIDYEFLLGHTVIGCLTVLLDREQTGPVRMPDLPQHEDLVLWYSLLKRGFLAHGLQKDLARYRVVRGSTSSNKVRSALHMWEVYRRVEGLSVGRSLRFFGSYAVRALWKHSV
ncbi:MAG: glycosyltransferase family 2 protein [Candidatus Eiseniibacteriota bacterium]